MCEIGLEIASNSILTGKLYKNKLERTPLWSLRSEVTVNFVKFFKQHNATMPKKYQRDTFTTHFFVIPTS